MRRSIHIWRVLRPQQERPHRPPPPASATSRVSPSRGAEPPRRGPHRRRMMAETTSMAEDGIMMRSCTRTTEWRGPSRMEVAAWATGLPRTYGRGTAMFGTGTSPKPEGAPHVRPSPPAIVVQPQRPNCAPARHADLEADGGARCHDLGGRHRLLRAVRHRPVAGPLPGRHGPAIARPLRRWRADLRPGPPDGRPARSDPEVALPARGLRAGPRPDRADPVGAPGGADISGRGGRALGGNERVTDAHRRAEPDLRGRGDPLVREAPPHGPGPDVAPGGRPARVPRGDRRLAADPPGARPGSERVRGLGGDGRPVDRRLPHGAPELRPDLQCRPRRPAALGLDHAGDLGGDRRVPGLQLPVPRLRPVLRQLRPGLWLARGDHGA